MIRRQSGTDNLSNVPSAQVRLQRGPDESGIDILPEDGLGPVGRGRSKGEWLDSIQRVSMMKGGGGRVGGVEDVDDFEGRGLFFYTFRFGG